MIENLICPFFLQEVICQPSEIFKLAVPSLLYTIQNNLLYFALTHLDAATFQVGYQVSLRKKSIIGLKTDNVLPFIFTSYWVIFTVLLLCFVFFVFIVGYQVSLQ